MRRFCPHRHHAKGRRYCKDVLFVADAEGTSVFDTPRAVAGRRPGMSAIVGTPPAASRTASPSQARQSTKPLEPW